MHELRIHLAACHGQVADGQCIRLVGCQRLFFGDVHLIVGGRVDHHRWVEFRDARLDNRAIGDVDHSALEAVYFISARGKFRFQLDSKLSAASKNRDPFAFHHFILAYLDNIPTVDIPWVDA